MKITATTTAAYIFPSVDPLCGALVIQNLDASIGVWVSLDGVATSNPVTTGLDAGLDSFYLAPSASMIVDDQELSRRVGGRVSVVAASATAAVNACRLK